MAKIQKVRGTLVTVTLTVTVKNFHWEMLRKSNGQLPTYIGGPEKNLGTIPNVKFFTADPYFGVVFSTGLRKSAQNSTFLRF